MFWRALCCVVPFKLQDFERQHIFILGDATLGSVVAWPRTCVAPQDDTPPVHYTRLSVFVEVGSQRCSCMPCLPSAAWVVELVGSVSKGCKKTVSVQCFAYLIIPGQPKVCADTACTEGTAARGPVLSAPCAKEA